MKKNLQFDIPRIAHSPVISAMFAILGNKKNVKPWIMSNFINIYYNSFTGEDQFLTRCDFFAECPWLKMCVVDIQQLEALNVSLIDYIKKSVDLGYYVYIVVKTWYIAAYSKKDFADPTTSHNMLIYGYDDDRKKLCIADHFTNGKYATSECGYDELLTSLQHFYKEHPFYYNIIRTFKFKDVYYKFEIEPLKRRLSEYVNSTNVFDSRMKIDPDYGYDGGKEYIYKYVTYRERKEQYYFGLSIYDELKRVCIADRDIPIRAFQLIVDHKKLMIERIDYLAEVGVLTQPDYDELLMTSKILLNESVILRNLVIKLKYEKSLDVNGSSTTVCNKIETIKSIEKKFIERLVYLLDEKER